MKLSIASASWLIAFLSLVSVSLFSQVAPGVEELNKMQENRLITTYDTAPNTAVLIVHTFVEEKPVNPDRSVRVDLTNLANNLGVSQVVPGRDVAVFVNTAVGKYAISVTAVGYLSTRQEISVGSPVTQEVDVVLHRDPTAVTLNEASGLMSAKARKEAKQAVSLLKSGDLDKAEKHLKAAYLLAPSNADLNFLMGYLYFQKNDYAQAGTYLETAVNLRPHFVETLTLLGRTKLALKDYPAAQSALEQASLVDSEDWLPHELMADTYLHKKEYSKARDEAQIAVGKGAKYGKQASAAAELTLGQALIALGETDKGIQALRVFLKQSPSANMVDPVQGLIKRAQEVDHAPAGNSTNTAAHADPLMALPKLALSMQTWRPPDIDDVTPSVEPGVTCPSAQVLAGAGKRVQELMQDITRFTAEEDLFHKSLDAAGLSNHAETRKYNYAADISSRQGSVFITDYNQDRVSQDGYPDGISSGGFVMLALVFHPGMQGDFNFDCEGQGKWFGKPSWLVHFRQRSDRPNRMQEYSLAGKTYRVDLKGRAWISSDTFQIMHIEADITNPIHEVQLLGEHQVVEYGPVPFAKKNTMLWLPKNVEIYFDLRKHHYYRRYSFDHYMLFDVDATEKDKAPPAFANSVSGTPTENSPNQGMSTPAN